MFRPVPMPPFARKHLRALSSRVRRRSTRFIIAFILISIAASALVVVRSRAAGERFPWPTTLSKIFGGRNATPLSPPEPVPVAVNTTNNLTAASGTASLLTPTTNWSLNHVPIVSEDATYTGTTTGIRSLTAGSLIVGSFDVTGSSGTFSIRNNTSGGTDSTLTLGGAGNLGNGVSGTASADLLYVASGATFALRGDNGGGGSGVLKVVLGQSGNFDAVGTMSSTAVISDGGGGFGITKTGTGTLTLSAVNTYTGTTAISVGSLVVNSSGSLASTKISTASGATFDVLSHTGTVSFTGSQTLDGTNTSATPGTINGNLTMNAASPITLAYASGNPTLNVTNGTLTLLSGETVTLNTSSALGAGNYTLISANGTSGFVAGTAPANLTMAGSGLATGMAGSLQINGSQLVLHVQYALGDVAVDVFNTTIKKLNGADGTVAWSVTQASDSSLAVDQFDFGVYTAYGSQSVGLPGNVYKYNAVGGLAWTNTVSVSGGCNFNRVTGVAVDTTSSSPGVVWSQTGCGGGIAKSDRTTGLQQWSVFTNDVSRPSIDPANGQIYDTTVASCCSYNTIYSATTAGAISNSAASCEGSTELNPADGMLYRGGNMGTNGCGLNLSQLNKSALATPNWTIAVPGITSFDALAVQPWSGGHIYVGSASNSKVVVVDPATQSVITSFTTAVPAGILAVNPNGGTVYVANSTSHFVYAYSPTGALVWTSPDLGAPVYNLAAPRDFVGTAPTDSTPPVITYTPLGDTTSIANRGLSATVTDTESVVPTSGAGLPVIYFRKGTSGPYSSTQSTSAGGGAYNFSIDYSLVSGGSVSGGDTIQYFVAAQDSAPPHVTTNPSTGASGFTASPPAASTPPTTPNSYSITPADVVFNASGNLAAGTYHDVTVNGCFTATMTGDVVITGTMTVNNCGVLKTGPFVVSGSGSFVLVSGGWLGSGNANGITTAPTASGSIQTATRSYSIAGNYLFNAATNQVVGNGLPGTIANLQIENSGTAGNNTVTGNIGQIAGHLGILTGIYLSASDYTDVEIVAPGTLSLAGPITLSGNWINSGTFLANGFGVTFDGTTNQNISGSTPTAFATLAISNTGVGGSNTVSLSQNISDTALNITSGIFDQGASFNVTSGAVTVSSGATWSNTGTGDLTLSGGVANAGTITFNANGAGCPQNDDISITSSVGGTQRAWSGAGTFSITDVSVQDQGGTAVIGVRSGTSVSGNGLNWLFVSQCSAYTWAGTASTDWTNPLNWSPARTTPASSDIVFFGSGTPSPIVTNVAGAVGGTNESIAELHIASGVLPSFSTGTGANTLTIDAGSGNTGFDTYGLTITGANALTIKLQSGTLGAVTGPMIVNTGAHRLIGQAASAITFQSGSTFRTDTGFTGNVFGDGSNAANGAAGSIVFASGATYFHNAGSSPFGAAVNASVVTFQTGSEADWLISSGFQASGRTYANLVIGDSSAAVNVSDTGAGSFQFDNLTVNNTGSANSSLSFTGSGSSAVNIKGNVRSTGAGTGAAGTVANLTLTAGSGGIQIDKTGSGTITFDNSGNSRSILFLSDATVTSGTTLALGRVLQMGLSANGVLTVSGAITPNVGAAGYVIGNVLKTFAAAGSKTFEVGTPNGYSPVDVNATTGTFPANFTVKADQNQLSSIHGVSVNALQRNWTITGPAPGAVTANLTFHYLAGAPPTGDIVGTPASYVFFKRTAGVLSSLPPNGAPTSTTAVINGVSSFSDWTLAEPSAVTAGTLQFSASNYNDTELNSGTHLVTITVTRTGGVDGAASVHYATSNGSATTADNDYDAASGDLNWADNDSSSQTFTVTVHGDTNFEPSEIVNLTLSSAAGATLGSPNPATLTIVTDDICSPPSTVYVDDSWIGTTPGTDPDTGGPATNFGCDSFATIQDGINGVTSGGTVIVRPGTYAEAILINKPLTLQGAQVGQNANTRFAAFVAGLNGPKANPAVESVITAAATAPASGANDTLHVMANNVTIDGFVVDGNNPGLAQGGAAVVGGINTDSRRAIQTEDAAGTTNFPANNVTVQYNVIQNFAQRGVELVNGASSGTAPATTGNVITQNVVRNFGLDGIVLAFNAYADITNNTVVTNDFPTEAGIWVQDFLNTGTPHTTNINNNTVTVGQDNFGGIWVNLAYLANLNINNNTVNAAASVFPVDDFTYGIYLTSLRPGTTASLNNNIVGSSGGQFDRGIALWNVGTSPTTTTVTGGTVGKSVRGISLVDNDPNFGLAGSNSTASLSGVSVSGTGVASPIGISVDAVGSTGDTVALEISGNTSVSNTATAISVTGANASANIHNNSASIHDNTVGISVDGGSATITSNNLYANATSLQFLNGGTSTAHFNRIISTTTAIANPNNLTPNLENNWWGCNAGPGNTGCGAVTGTGADFDPWIVLLVSATPAVIAPGGMSTVTADMTHNSAVAQPVGTLPDMPVAWSATQGTMAPPSGTVTAGTASSTFTSTSALPGTGCATVDNQLVCTPVTVNSNPNITAAAPLSRQQGSAPVNGQIATVSDAQQPANTLGVTATPLSGTGVTISNISVDGSGNVAADVAASCTATNSTFTLTVTDNQSATATDTLTVNVTANTAPTLSYAPPPSLTEGNSLTINPATGPSDNGTISSIVVQSPGTYTGTISVNNSTGVVSISNAAPVGGHTITIRATDNCGVLTDATFTLNVNAASCTTPPSGMVAWYPGDGNADDIFGGHHGTMQGGATFAAGKVSQAFNFSGSGQFVQIPHNAVQNTGAQITLDAWIRPTTLAGTNNASIVNKRTAANVEGYTLELNNTNGLYFEITTSTGIHTATASNVLAANTWQHAAATFDGAAMKIFVNGVQVASSAADGTINAVTSDLAIGKNIALDSVFPGQIDEVEIFNTALSGSDIANIYNASFAGKCRTCTAPPSGMVSWWDGSGVSPTANDIYGTSNGTLQNGATFAPGKVGQALSFDGVDDQVVVPHNANQNTGGQITIDAWVNPTSFGDGRPIAQKRSASNVGGYTFEAGSTGNLSFSIWIGGVTYNAVAPAAVLTTGVWKHVAATYDGATMKIYVDGVEKASNAVSGVIDSVTDPFVIGRNVVDGSAVWHGSIDELELFNRALQDFEIRALADAGNAGKCRTSTIQFSSATYNVTEGNTNAAITVTRTGAHDTSASFHYATSAGSAIAGTDYDDVSGDLTFDPGQVTKSFNVPIHDDSNYEGDETVSVQLSAITGTGVSPGTPLAATLTIHDDETAPNITINDVSLNEGSPSGTTTFTFTVTLSTATQSGVIIAYSTQDGTATLADHDYLEVSSGALVIPANQTTGQFNILVKKDTVYEPDETFFVNLNDTTVGTITDDQGQGTIVNDDTDVSVAVAPLSVAENGAPNLVYTFTRNGPTTDPLTVNFSVGGTAKFGTNPGDDYIQTGAASFTSSSGTVTIGATNSSATVTIDPTTDATYEANETAVLTVTSGAGYNIGGPSVATGTINNDDNPPTVLVVNSTLDTDDGFCLQAPDGDCTLREAINAANANPDANTIKFNIPVSDPNFTGGVFTIKPLNGEYALTSGLVTIDGASQTAFTTDTNPAGPEIVIDGSSNTCGSFTCNGFSISSSGNSLLSLVINNFTAHGISMFGAGTGNTIKGCYVGTDPTGTVAAGNAAFGITSPGGNTIGGLSAGEGNVISGNGFPAGFGGIGLSGASDIVRGNKIGTNAAGTAALANKGSGIVANGGGSNVIEGNLISGNTVFGIELSNGSTDSNTVKGNKIGTDAGGTTAVANGSHGIRICCGAGNNTIGGANPGDGNVIAFNGGAGVVVQGLPATATGAVGNRIFGNSIFANTGLGIDLANDGVTPNDPGDTDTDPDANNLQNFPVIRTVLVGGPGTIRGTLNSTPSQTFTIDLYSSPNGTGDASGNGEGKTYLGSTTTTTGANGDGLWSFASGPVAAGDVITATATDASGNTSEFSAWFTAKAFTAGTIAFSQGNIDSQETNSGTHTVPFTITRTGGSDGAVSVDYTITGGGATIGEDYTVSPTSGTFTWANGNTADKTITITVNGDTKFETDEIVNLTLSNVTGGASIGTNPATLTIKNDDSQPQISINDVTHSEGNAGTTDYDFTVSLSNASYQQVTVNAVTADNSATTGGLDYTGVTSTQLTFAPDTTTQHFHVLVNGDLAVESDEQFFVNLSGATNASILKSQGVGTIVNDDTNVSVAVSTASVVEDGATNLVYTFTRNPLTSGPITVNFAVSGTADFGTDYTQSGAATFTSTAGTVVIPNGATTATVTLDPTADTTVEPDETVSLTVSSGTGYNVGTPSLASATITNDDTDVTVTVSPSSALENDVLLPLNNEVMVYTFTRTGVTTGAITVNFSVGGTATFPADYTQTGAATFTATSGTVTFGDGVTTATVTVDPVTDAIYETNESVILTVTTGTGYNPGTPAAASGTITNDDPKPSLTIGDRIASEGTVTVLNPGPTTNFVFTVTRTGSTEVTATVDFATQDGITNPATGGAACGGSVDYVSQNGTLTFLPNQSSKTITIAVCKDPTVEANETFFVELSNVSEATITDGEGKGTIQNDDSPGTAVVVNTTDDVTDGLCDSHCTLREAITAANGSPDASIAINFSIPPTDSRHFYYKDDGIANHVTLAQVGVTTAVNDASLPVDKDPDWPHGWWSILPTSALPAITHPAVVDGSTQTGWVVNTLTGADNAVLRIELSGESAGPGVAGLTLSTATSGVQGLVINRFTSHGFDIQGGTGNTIVGNFIGTDVSGTLDLGNTASGISNTGNGLTIGGPVLPRDPPLTDPVSGINVISGNNGDGVSFSNSNSNMVVGNLIGTKANGTSGLGNSGSGISFTGAGSGFNTIGGSQPTDGNTIAFNGADGVRLPTGVGVGIAIRGNSIFSNGSTANDLGIDLGVDGKDTNDANDADTGPNNLQNFPVITSALVTGSTRTITGTLNSTVGDTFTIDFYQSPSCDASGNGEGKTFLGSTSVVTDGVTGTVSFTFHPAVLTVGQVVTATATSTGASSSTSEFSACAPINDGSSGAGDIQFTSATYTVAENVTGPASVAITLTRVGGSNGSISAQFTTGGGTATAGADYTNASQTVTFVEGETSKTINVSILDDAVYEGNETVNLSLGASSINVMQPDVAIVDPHAAVLTITENDPKPVFTINDITHSEGNSGTTAYTFTVTKTNGTALNASVDYATVNGTATAPSDFTAISATTLTFLPADATKQFTVLVNGDTTVEPDEKFSVHLSNPVNATIGDADGDGTITSDDTDVSVGVSPASVAEDGVANLVYTFTRSGITTGALTVNFSVGGTATFATDYTQSGAATFAATSGTITFGAGSTTATVTIDPTPDVLFEANETAILTVTSGAGYNVASPSAATGTINNDDAAGGIVRFSSATYNTTESSGVVTITVQRVGDTSAAATVDYTTPDDSAATSVTPCATISGAASPRCDFTTAIGTLRWAAGDSAPKTFNVLISQDNYVEGPETLTLTLSNLTGGAVFGVPSSATLTIADDATEPAANPIDDASNFVRQQYHDFLNREPDAAGLAFWTNEITSCGSNAQCIDFKRVQVSAAFYISIEFQDTGYLVERLYKASYGDANGLSTFGGSHTLKVPIIRFSEFLPDTQEIGLGVVVGQGNWQQQLETNKVAFADKFVQRARFTTAYANTLTPGQFVDALFANAGVVPTSADRQAAIDEFSGAGTSADTAARGRALRRVAENATLTQQEFNRAFVLMQYFGYLRRNPNSAPDADYTGFDFWLTKLNQFNGNFQNADMVKSFLVSTEYRNRAGQ